ncbi:MAG: 5-dehydro-2-deoxygluconokinase [Hasllibacter sp.]
MTHEPSLNRLKTALAGGRVLVIGRVGMDLSPDPPGTATAGAARFAADIGGSSANIAVGLVKLGLTAGLVTTVSDDAVADFCLAGLDRYGVDRRHVRTVGGEARTSLAIYESRLADHRTVLYRNNAADFAMDRRDVDAIDWGAWDVLITTGTVLAAEPSRGATFAAFDAARAAGVPIVFDIDWRPYSWASHAEAAEVLTRACAIADAVIGNDEEFGFTGGDPDRHLETARAVAARAALTVHKMGPGGAITFAGGDEIRTGIFPVRALKPTGAGDSFCAGLLAALSEGRPLREAVLRGSACASITVSKPQCAPAMPDTAELEAFLADHPGPTEPE